MLSECLLKAGVLIGVFSVQRAAVLQRAVVSAPGGLFRWFSYSNMMDRSFEHSEFAKNRQRLLEADAAAAILPEISEQARTQRLSS